MHDPDQETVRSSLPGSWMRASKVSAAPSSPEGIAVTSMDGDALLTGTETSCMTEPPSSSTIAIVGVYVESSPYVWVRVNVPMAAGGSWVDVRATVSIAPTPQSTNAVWVSSQPGSENVTVIDAGDPSTAPVTATEPISGATFWIVYSAVAVAVRSPSETSTVTVPTKLSPKVTGGETGEDIQPVSQVPSLVKSHRNCRLSPSGSDDALASNSIGEPSNSVKGPVRTAVGAWFVLNTSTIGISEWASTVSSAFVSTAARGSSIRPAGRWGLSSLYRSLIPWYGVGVSRGLPLTSAPGRSTVQVIVLEPSELFVTSVGATE